MTNRVHIDAPAGVVEIEGEKEFVEGLLAKVFPLLEAAGFGSRPPTNDGATGDQSNDLAQGDQPLADQNGKGKTKKRRGTTPPKGQSCADRILTLKQEGFFKFLLLALVCAVQIDLWLSVRGGEKGSFSSHAFFPPMETCR